MQLMIRQLVYSIHSLTYSYWINSKVSTDCAFYQSIGAHNYTSIKDYRIKRKQTGCMEIITKILGENRTAILI